MSNSPSIDTIFTTSPIIPVLALDSVDDAKAIADVLCEGGLKVLEITLRTEAALECIEALRQAMPEAIVGAGTVMTAEQLKQAENAGAQFAFAPGWTETLASAAQAGSLPFVPGVATASEVMRCIEQGYHHLKFFPAEAMGGRETLNAWAGPFPEVAFCPTGGVKHTNVIDYLMLKNVSCVGGSWLVSQDWVASKSWEKMRLATRAIVEKIEGFQNG